MTDPSALLEELIATWRAAAEYRKQASRDSNHCGNKEMDAYHDGWQMAYLECANGLRNALLDAARLRGAQPAECPNGWHDPIDLDSDPRQCRKCGLAWPNPQRAAALPKGLEPQPQTELIALVEAFIAAAENYRIHSELTFPDTPIDITVKMLETRDKLRDGLAKGRDPQPEREPKRETISEHELLLRRIIAKLDVILPKVDGIIAFNTVRSGHQAYDGPNLIEEIKEAKELLGLPSPPVPEQER